jgi:spore germination cell wall hydrolase CwlJ-like protein
MAMVKHIREEKIMINKLETMTDIDIMARTIYGEARGEYGRIDGGMAALIGIGNVIVNRVNASTWFGGSIRDVCLKPYQFSCWNGADANRVKILGVTEEDAIFVQCLDVALGVAEKRYPDLTKGANHYYSSDIAPPKWAANADERVRIGKHRFFKLG